MFLNRHTPRIARSIVAILCAGFIQLNFAAPAAHAAAPIKPTIASITAGSTTLTVNMVITGIDASVWKWSITKRTGISCANTYGDGAIQTTGSLLSAIPITGLTSGCTYTVKVAGYNGVTGEYTDAEKLVGGFSNGLTAYYMNDSNPVATMVHTPISSSTSGYCGWDTVSAISKDWGTGAPTPANPSGTCNADNFTVYYVGYIKAPTTGNVTFKSRSDDGFYLNIQGVNAITDATGHGPAAAGSYNGIATVYMVSGEVYRIETWVHEVATGAAVYLDWQYDAVGQTNIPPAYLATDPSVFGTGCPLGLAARCAGGSALEIKRATGANMNGQYWIMVNGIPTLTYCIMDSAMSGGGWMLAMKGKETGSALSYTSNLWTDTTLSNESYPERWLSNDANRDVDAKYGVFSYNKINQIMALFPQQKTYAGGATNSQNATYGFSWIETTTSMLPWTAYNASASGNYPAGWGGTSYATAYTGGPTATPTCVNVATTLSNLFNTASRCAFRQVAYLYSATESPYSAIGDKLFYSQNKIRFFGLNYGSANTGNRDRVRFGFGWNENEDGNEGSNDGTGGIGIDNNTWGTSLTAGSGQRCCANQTTNPPYGQNGISGGDNTYDNIPFEMYIRNSVEATIYGNNLRVTSKRTNSMTSGNTFSATGTNGSNTFRLSPAREGIYINPSTGVVTVSEALPVGDYTSTVSVTDTNGVMGTKTFTVQVLSESSETDTALSFNGTSQYVTTSGTYGLWGDQTHEAWVKSDSACNQTTSNKVAFGNTNLAIFCNSSYWWVSFKDNSNAWAGKQTSQRVVVGDWVHIAVVRSGTTVTAFFNNAQTRFWISNAWATSYAQATVKNDYTYHVVGGSGGTDQYFNGVVDEVKVWDSARTLTQIWNGANSQENVSDPNLLIYWDFNEGTGSAISRSQRVDNNFNLTPSSPSQWVPIAQTSTSGPYTVVTVPRTLISVSGGWRAPDSITAIYAMVVAGGGGGGGGYQGGGGGGGGVLHSKISVNKGEYYPIRVGTGGNGAFNPTAPSRGETSTAFGLVSLGGGAGGVEFQSPYLQIAATSGGSGGGGVWGNYLTGAAGTSGQGSKGGDSLNLEAPTCSTSQYMGAGGGGAGASTGYAPTCTRGGNGGIGKLSYLNTNYYGGGGGGSARYANSTSFIGFGGSGGGGDSGYTSGAMVGTTGGATSGGTGTGGGGGAGMSSDGATGYGGDGGSGVVILRYITALKPVFTAPKNAYLNAGMTETFSVNVAADSATSILTRTFRWESSTSYETGTYSLIKEGTGADFASFAWVPPDTSTSGSRYVYRVIVTDSDTAGLFIVDTSTAVYAVINGKLLLKGKTAVKKTINVARSETYTITDGTPDFVASISPSITGITIDTSTTRSVVLKINETVTVGTYLETITVTDSVTGTTSFALTITVAAPPTLVNTSAPIDSGLIFDVNPANSASYSLATGALSDVSGSNHPITSVNGFTYSKDYMGIVSLSYGSGQYLKSTGFGLLTNWTIESYIRVDTLNNENCIICGKNTSGNIPYYLAISGTGTIAAGFRNSNGAHFRETNLAISTGQWNHISATFDGTLVHIYINGVEGGYSLDQPVNGTLPEAAGNDLILINTSPLEGTPRGGFTIGYIRLYNYGFTSAKNLTNYKATGDRFLNANINRLRITQKYGSTTTETFTATGGIDTKTVMLNPVGFTGIVLDTSTVNTVVFKMLSNAPAGTYYDTVTVTDDVGASTQIVFTIFVAKADTVTVYIETPTSLSYTGASANFTPTVRVTGLVSTDTGTAVSSITYRPGGLTCATGGSCSIGDIGPGGGVVFITPSTAGGNGNYFEAAPSNWFGMDDIASVTKFCTAGSNQDGISRAGTQAGIGWGDTNTAIFDTYCTGGAIQLAADYAGGGYTDWFMPSADELTELAKVRNQAGLLELGSAWSTGTYGYWGSNEASASVVSSLVSVNSAWSIGGTNKSDSVHNMVRPVRQFSPCWSIDSCTALSSTNKPVNAGGYAITPAGFSLSTGSLANYETVTYTTTFVTINRIAQSSQQIPFYNPKYPDTFTVYTGGGSGSGAQLFTVLAGGTASNCSFDYRKLKITSAGTCNVQVVKMGDRNYLPDTATASIYQILFATNQPSGVVGSGPNIGLNGATSFFVDPNAAPMISSITLGAGSVTITGSGFGSALNTNTIVKFWRNQIAPLRADTLNNYVANDTTIYIYAIPAGATAGRIAVITANGTAVSVASWTP